MTTDLARAHLKTSTPTRVVGEVVEHVRQALGLNQTAFAERIGRSQTYVSMIESGRRRMGLLEFLDLMVAADTHVTLKFGNAALEAGLVDVPNTVEFTVEMEADE